MWLFCPQKICFCSIYLFLCLVILLIMVIFFFYGFFLRGRTTLSTHNISKRSCLCCLLLNTNDNKSSQSQRLGVVSLVQQQCARGCCSAGWVIKNKCQAREMRWFSAKEQDLLCWFRKYDCYTAFSSPVTFKKNPASEAAGLLLREFRHPAISPQGSFMTWSTIPLPADNGAWLHYCWHLKSGPEWAAPITLMRQVP